MSRVMDRVMDIATPLGEGVLLFHGMRGREELGRISEYHLDLLSDNGEVDVDAILGKNVTIKLALPDDSTRHFNGFVTRFAQGEMHGRYYQYTAVVHPWLWYLTRTADCRIFQEMTVPDILKKVFADHPVADFKFELTSSYRKWTYCVQYRETDFNFVSRLMEHEGIYYYVRHTDGHNTLVITDSCSKHTPAAGCEELAFIPPERLVRPELEHIGSWQFSREIQPGVYVHKDYDLERPSVDLKTQKVLARTYSPSNYEVFDYPGTYVQKPDGEQYAGVRIDEFGTQFEVVDGMTNARGMTVGALFTLDGHPRADQNREHLVIAAHYDLVFSDYEAAPEGGGTSYQCRFSAMSTQQQFRPRRATPKPFVQGPQTAMVVGPAGDEIYTDQFGRVKVQFHWDRLGKKDENSSCWMRVSHPWAGKGWGAVSTPRIGQEVIVDFLEGDPDQPIVTGRVYNAECQPPFGFPAGAVLSGIKSNTHKGSGFNELSMDDTAGKERVFVHGQYNMDTVVEHDQTSTIHNCRTDKVDVDDSETVGGNQTLHVVKNQTVNIDVNRKETVGGTETITITGHRSETVNGGEDVTVNGARSHTVNGVQTTTISLAEAHTVGAARAHTVGGAEAITVGAAQMVSVGAAQMINVGAIQSTNVGANRSVTVAGGQTTSVGKSATTTIGADESLKVVGGRSTDIGKDDATKVAKNWVIDAGESIVLKTGDASITMKKDGTIVIKGKDLTVRGSGKINVKADGDIVMKGSKIE
ncbi:MAG TPA: type VI secretion system tip protein TssI/VgrG, partial [Vicinamibacterales bacterium]|nr:type VI secretion system tip protein TssI/VgrG [Vicinamibacterales bacterium]